jgi:hypothetical protein
MTRSSITKYIRLALIIIGVGLLLFFCVDAFARVGGGHSYGGGSRGGGGGSRGGSSGGSGDGGAIIWLIFELFRLLVYLTIEYPLIGIPLDIIVIGGVVFFLRSGRKRVSGGFASYVQKADAIRSQVADAPLMIARKFNQLRKFDPNFSEIVFTDFCYALYGKAQEARGRGANQLDLFSPYLSEVARQSLLQRNPKGLQEVKGHRSGPGQRDDLLRPGVLAARTQARPALSGASDSDRSTLPSMWCAVTARHSWCVRTLWN